MSYLTFLIRGITPVEPASPSQPSPLPLPRRFTPLRPVRHWLESIKIQDPQLAHRLCKLIPAQCPFERNITVRGRVVVRIPPLCKLNPFYEELVYLRFQALCYLADECGEDISAYC
ncbi:MAG: Mo-dependent nitrogenase C-terminal domain-containing protein [Planktothrix sp. GU0601_MAG3]|nr:MAG: Mo-dependent nitrogenase C-terminal domain-containing protein [Planktothrix sp. GU0601_MAG3]